MENEIIKTSFIDKASGALSKAGAFMGQQKHFSAIRDAFGAFLPLLVVGAIAVMINSVLIVPDGLLATMCGADENAALYENWATASSYISPLFDGINNATMNLFSVYIAFLLGFFLMGSYGGNQLMGGLMGLAAFMLLSPMEASAGFDSAGVWNGGVGTGYLGAKGIVFAMATGLTAPGMLWRLQNVRALKITMPEGVPPVVANSLNSLFPFIITVFTFGAIQPLWHGIMMASGVEVLQMGNIYYNAQYIIEAVYALLVSPFMSLSQTMPAVMLVLFLVSLFWFFGVHGSNVMAPVINALWTPATVFNIAFYAAYGSQALDVNFVATEGAYIGQSIYIWTEQSMNSFVFLGGSSAVIGLLIGINIFSKLPEQRAISAIATPISCFNISEPVMFGLPVVLNPVYFVPFLFANAILGGVAYTFTALGFVNPTVVMIPWTAPVFLTGFLSTLDWRSLILTAINLSIAIGLYLPFVLLDIKQQTNTKAQEAGMEVSAFKEMAYKQMAEEKIERKANKEVSKITYKIELLENDVEFFEDKAEEYQDKLEEVISRIEMQKGNSEHNSKVYENLGEESKAKKERAKISSVDERIKSAQDKYKAKIEKVNQKKEKSEKEIKALQDELPQAEARAQEKIALAKASNSDKSNNEISKDKTNLEE